MDVEPADAEGGSAEHRGTTYWFCNPVCREKFVADRARYLEPRPAEDTAVALRNSTRPPPPEPRGPAGGRGEPPGWGDRHGGGRGARGRRGAERRAGRHEPALLGEPG